MSKINLTPRYASKKFNSISEFNSWLNETYHKKIYLEDLGQDITRIWVDEKGEILHCNFHAGIYNGLFININELQDFYPIQILEDGNWVRKLGLLVRAITPNKNKREVVEV